MRSKENTPPIETLKYVSTLENHTLAMHLKAYKVSADLYGLPPYLVALLHEAIKRLHEQETKS